MKNTNQIEHTTFLKNHFFGLQQPYYMDSLPPSSRPVQVKSLIETPLIFRDFSTKQRCRSCI